MKSFVLTALAGAVAADSWGYIKKGADWPGQCKSGKYQSPVDFVKNKEFNRGFLKANLSGFTDTDNYSFYMPADLNNSQNNNGSPTLGAGPKGAFPGNQKVTNSFLDLHKDTNAINFEKGGKKAGA
jgi:hypothetical protein